MNYGMNTKDYLPKKFKDSNGGLQDALVCGLFGYFPTYSLVLICSDSI